MLILILKFTQRRVTMTTGFSVPERERKRKGGKERDSVFHCDGSE